MANLFPEILGLEAGLNSELAKRIVDRVKAGNPGVAEKPYKAKPKAILNVSETGPNKVTAKRFWQEAKKALVIREKCKVKEPGY